MYTRTHVFHIWIYTNISQMCIYTCMFVCECIRLCISVCVCIAVYFSVLLLFVPECVTVWFLCVCVCVWLLCKRADRSSSGWDWIKQYHSECLITVWNIQHTFRECLGSGSSLSPSFSCFLSVCLSTTISLFLARSLTFSPTISSQLNGFTVSSPLWVWCNKLWYAGLLVAVWQREGAWFVS